MLYKVKKLKSKIISCCLSLLRLKYMQLVNHNFKHIPLYSRLSLGVVWVARQLIFVETIKGNATLNILFDLTTKQIGRYYFRSNIHLQTEKLCFSQLR